MSNDVIYWLIMGGAFVVAGGLGMILMAATKKMALASIVSAVVNVMITAIGCVWWNGLPHEGIARMFGLFGYGVAFVNIQVLILFALFIMRRQSG